MLNRLGVTCIALLVLMGAVGQARSDDSVLDRLLDSARQGSVKAQFTLALRYEHGRGTPRSPSKAVHWYCRAALQGSPRAQYNLAYLFFTGRGVPRDHGVAQKWFGLAAQQGDLHAVRMLRRLERDTSAASRVCGPEHAGWLPPRCNSTCQRAVDLVLDLTPEYQLDPTLVLALIWVESRYRADAHSPKDARGLMQLTPATAKRFAVQDPWDVEQNIRGGMAYLRWLAAYFRGDVRLVLAAYNAGEHAVERHGGVPPYPETQKYVEKILKIYGKEQHTYRRDWIMPSPVVASAGAHVPEGDV